MTALCGGGVSGPKSGVAETIIYTTTALASLLNNRGGWWAYVAAPLIGVLSYQATELCEVDPPADPNLTPEDYQALLSLSDQAAVTTAIGKMVDLARIAIWYQMCECKTTGTPGVPTAPFELDTTVTQPASTALYIPMLQGACKVLDLWNGSSNDAPPANWHLPTFDDSAWPLATVFANPWTGGSVSYQNGGSVALPTPPAGAVRWQLLGPPFENASQHILIRWRFTMPQVDVSDIIVSLGYDGTAIGGLTWVNGVAGSLLNPGNWAAQETAWLPGSTNVVALQKNTGSWSNSRSAFAFALYVPGGGLAFDAQDCAQLLSQIALLQGQLRGLLELVTLIQRQHVPFAYVPGLSYAALEGNGEIVFSDPILRLAVTLDVLPGHYGMAEGSPDAVFDVGRISLGTADGYESSRPITTTPFLLGVPGDVTRIGYSFAPGVVATIETFSREP